MRLDSGGSDGAAWSWLITLAALALLVWAVVDFVQPGGDGRLRPVVAPAGAESVVAAPVGEAIELHRLLPDATDDLGKPVRLDGTVVGESSPVGFWVRDLRDNIILVAIADPGGDPAFPAVDQGDAVRVRGVVALLAPQEQAARLQRAGLVLPTSAVVIRDIKVVPTEGGVEVLKD